MFGILLYDVLFFGIPIILIGLFGLSLYRYLSAKKQNRITPGLYSEKEITRRKIMMIALAVVAGVIAVVVAGFLALLFMAVAFM